MRHQAVQNRLVADDAEMRAGGVGSANASFGTVVQSGTVTYVNGVSPAIPAPAVKTGLGASKILFTLLLPNASTALGFPEPTLTAGVGFVVTSIRVTAPAVTETNDQSTLSYVIINPTSPD